MEERKRIGFGVMIFLVRAGRPAVRHLSQGLEGRALSRVAGGHCRGTALNATRAFLHMLKGRSFLKESALFHDQNGSRHHRRHPASMRSPGLENARWQTVKSPWGEPSDQLLTGTFHGVDMVFLPRHGRGHIQTPTSINYRANIDALKRVGVTDVISVSACGSLREELPPGTFVMADQFIDRTFAREKSFFGPGFVAHVSMAHPVCPRLSGALTLAARGREDRPRRRRHLYLHGRAAILHPRRKLSLSLLGLQRDRHDGDAGSQAGARGRAALRHRRHGDGLRLLASTTMSM